MGVSRRHTGGVERPGGSEQKLGSDGLAGLARARGNRVLARRIGSGATTGTNVEDYAHNSQHTVISELKGKGKYWISQPLASAPPATSSPEAATPPTTSTASITAPPPSQAAPLPPPPPSSKPAPPPPPPASQKSPSASATSPFKAKAPPLPGATPAKPKPRLAMPNADEIERKAEEDRRKIIEARKGDKIGADYKEEMEDTSPPGALTTPIAFDDWHWGRSGDEESRREYARESERARAQEAEKAALDKARTDAEALGKPFLTCKDYSYQYWFNYFWAEVPPTKRKSELHKLARDNPTATDGALLEEMLELGFVRVETSEMVTAKTAFQADPKSASVRKMDTDYTTPMLPGLARTGLGYRSDSRPPEKVKEHGGFHPALQQPGAGGDFLRKLRNLNESWNPFRLAQNKNARFVRRGNTDNDLQSVVSVAVDPRDSIRFPLPGSETSGGGRLMGKSDDINLYVVYIGGGAPLIDTTRWATTRAGGTQFGRGEVGAMKIEVGHVLLHIAVHRRYDEAIVGYIAGEVTSVTPMYDKPSFDALPYITRRALKRLEQKFGEGGALRFMENGKPVINNKEHESIAADIQKKREGGAAKSGGSV